MTDCSTDNTDDLQWEAYLLGVPDPPIYSKETLRSLIRIKKQENKWKDDERLFEDGELRYRCASTKTKRINS